MNIYRMVYYFGKDRDDWRDREFSSNDSTSALIQARMMTPPGWTLKKVEAVRKTAFNLSK